MNDHDIVSALSRNYLSGQSLDGLIFSQAAVTWNEHFCATLGNKQILTFLCKLCK